MVSDNNNNPVSQQQEVSQTDILNTELTTSRRERDDLKIELKRSLTKVDILNANLDRQQTIIKEKTDAQTKWKQAFMDEILELRKMKEVQKEQVANLEEKLKQGEDRRTIQLDENDELKTDFDNLTEQLYKTQEMLELQKTKCSELQANELKQNLVLKPEISSEKLDFYKKTVQDLNLRLEVEKQTAERELYLRTKIENENRTMLINNSQLESTILQITNEIEEKDSCIRSLEKIQKRLLDDLSDVKSENSELKSQLVADRNSIEHAKTQCVSYKKQLSQMNYKYDTEVNEKAEIVTKLDKRKQAIVIYEQENARLLRDNALLDEGMQLLKQELQKKELERENLFKKVEYMQVAMEEFYQHREASNELQRARWCQMLDLAEGIQTLSQKAVQN